MKTYSVDISKEYSLAGNASLDGFYFGTFRDDDVVEKRPTIIVVPGGGYWMVSRREAEPIAAYFMGKGYNVAILKYSVREEVATKGLSNISYPTQLLQLCASVDFIKKHADETHSDVLQLYLVGFSAGGHLVGNFATDYKNVNEKFGKDWDLQATAVALSYPVISPDFGHVDSYSNLLAELSDADKQKVLPSLKLDQAVSADTLPCFVWTTYEDNCVPAINSVKFAEECYTKGVPCELHMFLKGWHGLSTCDELTNAEVQPFMTDAAQWLPMADSFFKKFGK